MKNNNLMEITPKVVIYYLLLDNRILVEEKVTPEIERATEKISRHIKETLQIDSLPSFIESIPQDVEKDSCNDDNSFYLLLYQAPSEIERGLLERVLKRVACDPEYGYRFLEIYNRRFQLTPLLEESVPDFEEIYRMSIEGQRKVRPYQENIGSRIAEWIEQLKGMLQINTNAVPDVAASKGGHYPIFYNNIDVSFINRPNDHFTIKFTEEGENDIVMSVISNTDMIDRRAVVYLADHSKDLVSRLVVIEDCRANEEIFFEIDPEINLLPWKLKNNDQYQLLVDIEEDEA